MSVTKWHILYDSIYRCPEDTESRLIINTDWEAGIAGEWDLTTNKYGVSFWSNENVLKFYFNNSCTTLWTYF